MNLNVYRNLHFRSLSAQKNKFYEVAKKLLRGIPPLGVITLHYEVFVETKRRLDIMNVGSIVDKYFSDTLTSEGVIEDDDFNNIPSVSFAFGGFADKEHILVTITEIEKRKEDTPMRVLLDQNDIQEALTTYISTLNIPNAAGVKLDVVDGMINAEITFLPLTNPTAPEDMATQPEGEVPTKPKRRGGRPAGSKNKPKNQEKEVDDVGTPVQAGAAGSSEGDNLPSVDETATADPVTEGSAEVAGPTPTGTKKGNLFGDRETPSSEDDGQAEAAPAATPEPVTEEPKVKRGSIFDA